jgi:putative transposase
MKKMQDMAITNNCIYALHYHLVLVTKRRRPVLTGPMLAAAEIAIAERCALRGGSLEEFGAETDHIHALVSLPPAATLAEFVNAVKTTTSRRLRRDFPQLRRMGDALWSPSYFVASCGGAPLDKIKEYVQAQERPD